jgi:hypothetical protein
MSFLSCSIEFVVGGGKGWKRGVEKAILEGNSPTKFSKYKEHSGGQTIRQKITTNA